LGKAALPYADHVTLASAQTLLFAGVGGWEHADGHIRRESLLGMMEAHASGPELAGSLRAMETRQARTPAELDCDGRLVLEMPITHGTKTADGLAAARAAVDA